MIKKNREKMSGQVVLMVLLASALILTLGLSASKQTTVETKIETDQELLKKAFNAAESGIEYYLGTGETNYSDGLANLSVANVGGSDSLSFGNMTLDGNLDYFWLVGHKNDGSLDINYYSGSSPNIKVCAISGSPTSFKLSYYYKDGSGKYQVENVNETVSGGCVTKSLTGNSLLLSVMPIGDDAKIEISGTGNFPSQGEEIRSTGIVEGVNNTVTVINKYVVLDVLLEAVSSGGDVTN
jgi:hypothetical protein